MIDLFYADYRRDRRAEDRKRTVTMWRQFVIATLKERDFWTTGRIRPKTTGDHVIRLEWWWDARSDEELLGLLEILNGLRKRSRRSAQTE
ncbi:hypothetical protein JQK15_13655 [Sphingobium sp. BHU LFT2]|uniref:hypothetical protein n=1 Tax=Sphingobium sp. BHU LFT2 TaxID=2807634 RepID=UPI001BE999EA|nr:hypothetical protein [Sphingobium sp. BHU LFT2]MBT2244585.1 hypothetical protein [Sphingobium sp. BHU LFT2]